MDGTAVGAAAGDRLDPTATVAGAAGAAGAGGVDWRAVAAGERAARIRESALRSAAEDTTRRVLADVAERENALAAAEDLAGLGSWVWEFGTSRSAESARWSERVHRTFGTGAAGPPPDYDVFVGLIVPADRERVLAVLRRSAETGERFEVDYRIARADGEVREVHSRGRAEFDADGRPVRLTGGVQDVTERNAAARELRQSRDLFAGVLDAATEQSIIATDPDGLITVFNAGAERMLGHTAAEMIGTSPERLHDPDEIQARARELGMEPGFPVCLAGAATGHPETRQWTYLTRDGARLQVSTTVSVMRGPDGDVSGFIVVGTDITARLNAESALLDSERRFRDTFRHAPHGIMLLGFLTENLGRILQVNPAMCRLSGYTESQLLGMGLGDLVPPEDREPYRQREAAFHRNPTVAVGAERHWIHADGHDLWVQISVSPIPAGSAEPYVVAQVEDITARKEVEAKLRFQALHDGLTGLPNRLLLMDRIEHALTTTLRTGQHVAVLYLDLDGFKVLNDTAGHAAGDQALVHVAERIRAVLRPSDTVARLGGDEFVVVCEGIDGPDAAVAVAERVLAAVRIPFLVSSAAFALSASMGISLSGTVTTADELLREADNAMYQAKQAGRARFRLGGIAGGAQGD